MNKCDQIIRKWNKAKGQHGEFGFYSVILPCRPVLLALCLFSLGLSPWVFMESVAAHSDVDPEIAEVTAELADQPTNVDLLLQRGQLYRFNGKLMESLYDLEKAWLLDPDNHKVGMERCRTLVALGRDHEAEPVLDQYLQGESGSSRVTALVERAQLYARTKRTALAIADFSEALTFYPTVEIYLARGHLQEGLGQLDAAAAGYLDGLSQLQQASILRRELIRVKMAQAQYTEALTLIDQELAEASGKTEWYLRRAEVLAAMGQTEEVDKAHVLALAEANRVLAKRPSALKRLARAKVYQAMGQLEAAKQDLRLVMEAAPSLTEPDILLKKLESQ